LLGGAFEQVLACEAVDEYGEVVLEPCFGEASLSLVLYFVRDRLR